MGPSRAALPPRMAATVARVEAGGLQPVDGVLDAHVERVVAAEGHLAGAHHGDQVAELSGV